MFPIFQAMSADAILEALTKQVNVAQNDRSKYLNEYMQLMPEIVDEHEDEKKFEKRVGVFTSIQIFNSFP